MTSTTLTGRKVAFLATDGVEEQELEQPWRVLSEAGATPQLVSLELGEITSEMGDAEGKRFRVDRLVKDVTARDFDALVLPGGVKNPDKLRTNSDAVKLVRDFMELDKPVAAICHGAWMLVEAGALRGRTVTSFPSLQTDVRNAGGEWVDRQVHVDQKLVTSRRPDDLPAFCSALVETMGSALEERAIDRMVEQTFPASDPLPGPSTL